MCLCTSICSVAFILYSITIFGLKLWCNSTQYTAGVVRRHANTVRPNKRFWSQFSIRFQTHLSQFVQFTYKSAAQPHTMYYTLLCCMPYGFATIFCNMSACFHSPPFFLTVKLFTPRLLIVTATFILSIVFAIDITVFFSSTIFIPFFPLYLTIFDFIDIGGFCWFYYYYYNFLFPFRCVHKINESIVMFREVFVRPQRQWRRPRRRWRRFLCVFLCESKRPPRLAQSQIPLLFCVCSWVWEYHVQCPVCGCVSFVIANIIAFTSQPPVNHGMDSLTQRTIVSPHLESNSNEQ